jgi:hypothetical protein
MTAPKLDRMALDDVGANSERLAAAIHEQLGELPGPVPVESIAEALDIVEIKSEVLYSIEGALITTPERGYGSIAVNSASGRRRQRFTLAHELLHFLNPWHEPTWEQGFRCRRHDMIRDQPDSENRHVRQESEANTFAIELLAPIRRIRAYLRYPADLASVIAMSDELDISKEAATRRYVAKHPETLAVVFSQEERFLYAARSKDFPDLSLHQNLAMPVLPRSSGNLSEAEEANPADWIASPQGAGLTAQTLRQRDGYRTTLLHIETPDEDGDAGIDDTYDRFVRAR